MVWDEKKLDDLFYIDENLMSAKLWEGQRKSLLMLMFFLVVVS